MAISYAAAKSAPMLEYAQERSLIREWQTNKNRQALERLILSHARLVFSYSAKLCSNGTDREELTSEGILGLIRAADLFDLAKEVRFSTYARWWVHNNIRAAFARMNTVVDVPVGGVTTDGPIQIYNLTDSDVTGLEGEVAEVFQSQEPTPEESLIAQSSRESMRKRIVSAMSVLNEIERDVVSSRSLQPVPEDLSDLSERLGISKSRLRQIERRALARLKRELTLQRVTAEQESW